MPRRRVVAKREILPDPKFGNLTLAKFMNHVMVSGKKSVAERIVYGALDIVEDRMKRDPVEIFQEDISINAKMIDFKEQFSVPEVEEKPKPTPEQVEENKRKWGYGG